MKKRIVVEPGDSMNSEALTFNVGEKVCWCVTTLETLGPSVTTVVDAQYGIILKFSGSNAVIKRTGGMVGETIVPLSRLRKVSRPDKVNEKKESRLRLVDWFNPELQRAVKAYQDQEASQQDLDMVIAYIQHHIHRPCWLEKPSVGDVGEEAAAEVRSFREWSLRLRTKDDIIDSYVDAARAV